MLSFRLADVTLVVTADAPFLEDLAARELRRYLFLLTGCDRPIATSAPPVGPVVLVGRGACGPAAAGLAEQEILVRTVARDGRPALMIAGGSPAATQWAVYAFLEQMGCGFYLGGDALPAREEARIVGDLDLRRAPVFAVRGTLPWYNFLNGPTTWNPGDHRRFYDQLAKQGANFVGFHSYDWEPWAAYLRGFTGVEMGEVLATSGANHHRDLWGPVPTATADYAFGTDRLFEQGLFGAACAFGYATYAEGVRQQQAMLSEALGYARTRGLRTCLGFEVAGDPDDEENIRILRARLEQLAHTYPLDYVWLWQAEGRGGGIDMRAWDVGATTHELTTHFSYLGDAWRVAEGVRICRYIQLGHRLLREIAPAVRLIVSGWGGDRWMAFTDFYRGLDATLPDDIIFSALDNIDPTFEPNVSTVYGELKPGRERWPIPWFESDGGGTRHDQWGPQPNVNAFAPLLDDAQEKGCQGILGIHWRTRAVEEVAGYTFRRAWEPALTPATYFERFARACYGPSAAEEMTAVHQRLEELGPRWTGAKGQVECGPFTWFDQEGHGLPPAGEWPPYRAGHLPAPQRFAELDALEERLTALHAQLRDGEAAGGVGQDTLARLTYLRSTLRWVISYDRAALHLWQNGPIEAALQRGEAARAAGDAATALTSGHEALALLATCGLGAAVQGLAGNVTNQGELGVLAAINGKAVAAYKRLIARAEALAGERRATSLLEPEEWPDALRLWTWPPGDAADPGRPFTVDARALGPHPIRTVTLHYRPLGVVGDDGWLTSPCHHERKAIYRGAIPAAALSPEGVAYYLTAEDERGARATTPLGSPVTSFTAIVLPTTAGPSTGSGRGRGASPSDEKGVRGDTHSPRTPIL